MLVPGDAVGDADDFENFGFNIDFTSLTEGGPVSQRLAAVNSSEAQPVPGITELAAPEDGTTDQALRRS